MGHMSSGFNMPWKFKFDQIGRDCLLGKGRRKEEAKAPNRNFISLPSAGPHAEGGTRGLLPYQRNRV